MSQGIVRITPRPGAMGTLSVTIASENPFGVNAGDTLSFPNPAFAVREGDTVDCTIDSAKTCTVNRVIVPVPAQTGNPTPVQQAGDE